MKTDSFSGEIYNNTREILYWPHNWSGRYNIRKNRATFITVMLCVRMSLLNEPVCNKTPGAKRLFRETIVSIASPSNIFPPLDMPH